MDKIRSLLDEIISEASGKLTPWEEEFVDSVSGQMDRGKELTDRQRDQVRRIHEQRVLGW